MLYIFLSILIVGILVLLIFLDLYFGLKYHRKNLKIHHFPMRHSDIEILTDGPKLFEKMFEDIEKSQHHIHMLFYIFRNDDFGKELIDLLIKKALEGVKIRILLDWVGSLQFPRQVMKRLKVYGIEVAFCHTPHFPFFLYFLQSRNHRKITVMDGKIGYLGGFNVGCGYIDKHPKLTPWRDCHARFTGEGVLDLQRQFLTDWTERTLEDVGGEVDYFPALEKGKYDHQFQSYEGVHLERDFTELIKNASNEILIGSPYFVPGKMAFEELIKALERNVKLTIIVPALSDHLLIQEASYRYLRKLLELGCLVYQYQGGFYHAKILIFDDTVCSVGTVNFDQRSFYFNHEMNAFIYDKEMVKRLKEIAEIDIAKSARLKLETLNRFDLFRSVKEGIAFLISPLL